MVFSRKVEKHFYHRVYFSSGPVETRSFLKSVYKFISEFCTFKNTYIISRVFFSQLQEGNCSIFFDWNRNSKIQTLSLSWFGNFPVNSFFLSTTKKKSLLSSLILCKPCWKETWGERMWIPSNLRENPLETKMRLFLGQVRRISRR